MTMYLNSTFWNNNPASGDIIKALYGSGDEGTAYTQNRSGYNSGSCLNAGMTVEFTWVVPTTTIANTIYVINSGTYDVMSSIDLENCVSFISSGTVIISGWMATVPVINVISKTNIIIEKIQVNGNNTGHYWLFINGWFNATVKDFQAYDNVIGGGDAYWVFLSNASYIHFINTQLYNNTYGLWGIDSNAIFVQSLQSYDNTLDGIAFTNLNTSIFSGLNIYSNGMWFTIYGSSGNQILNTNISGNLSYGISLRDSSFNIISGCSLSWNITNWIQLVVNSNSNTITNSNVYGLANSSIKISDSTWNTINQFLWNRSIDEYNLQWVFQYTIYNAYTQANNYIRLYSSDSATLTWNTLSSGTTFLIYFEELIIWPNVSQNYLMLTGVNSFVVWLNTWDGMLYAPIQITTGTKLWVVWETGTQLITGFLDTIEVVSGTTTYLTMNGGTGTISYLVLSWTSGQYLSILKSVNGNTWSLNTVTSWCILDSFLVCTFNANGTIKLFAFWTPGLYFTWTTQSWTIVTSGGIYNTWVSIYFTWLNISGATLNGTSYINSNIVTIDGTYVFLLTDNAGNSTGTTFTIDITNPTFGWATSGGYYNTGVTITFADLHLSGAIVSGVNNSYYSGNFNSWSTITGEWIYRFTVYDLAGNSTGMTFIIDLTNPLVTGNFPTSGLNISGGNTINFTRSWSDTNMSWYTLYITGTQVNIISTTAASSTVILMNWSYTWYVIAADRAGNTGTSQIKPFIISTPFSGTVTFTWPNAQYIWTQRYTRNYAWLYIRGNAIATYIVTGNIVTSITWMISPRAIANPLLTWADGPKDIFVTLTDGSGDVISKTLLIYLDTIAPIPTLTSPASGATAMGAFTLSWSAGVDLVWLSWYQYFISPTSTFGTIVKSWSTTLPSATIANWELWVIWIYYRYVKAIDKLGNSWSSLIQPFTYSGSIIDTTPNQFSFTNKTNAFINQIYVSNTITITWLSANTPVLASVNKWVLYISGNYVGTTGYVQNGWTVKIELISSSDYDDDVTSTLTIGWISANFSIRTMDEDDDDDNDDDDDYDYNDIDTNLSNTEKLMIIAIFETLRDLYAGTKETEFFNTLMLMLQSKIDDTTNTDEREALQYLYDLLDQYGGAGWGTDNTNIGNTVRIVNGVYTAPNGKRYTIRYDSARMQFTSPNFMTPKFFATLDVLRNTIDIYNPLWSQYASAKPILARWWVLAMEGQRTTSPYTAPNRKVFYFFKTIDGQYSSYTFTTPRYFDSLEGVKEFIFNTNK